ncbi:MAG: peptide deformylase [Oscillospiraceae bacterium]|jgi:peptide deformylase|nr:peptide deformylase [Oscillospiraceae bacterium]
MALRNIIKDEDALLRKRSRPVDRFDEKLATLLDDMIETMEEANGVGLAAPQVGILRRAVVVDVGEGPMELVNPEIIQAEGEQEASEGCLSLPERWGITKRPLKVTLKAQDRFGNEQTFEGSELLARAFCHELDHLNGVLFTDLAIRMLTKEEMEREDKSK